jgi:ATP-binding cassette subfamily B protein
MSWPRRLRTWLLGAGPAAAGGSAVSPAPVLPLRTVLRHFWPYVHPYRRWLWLSVAFAALSPAIGAATIWLYKVVVDQVLVPHRLTLFPTLVAAYLALTLLDGCVSFVDQYASTWVGERFLLDLRTALFRHLTVLPPTFYEGRPIGDVMERLTGDVGAIETLVVSSAAGVVADVIRLVVYGAALLYLRWDLALVALAVAPLFWICASRFSGRIREASRERRLRSGALTAVIQESLTSMPLVRAYGREDREVGRVQGANLGLLAAQMTSTRLSALFTPVVDLIEMGGVLVVLGVGTWDLAQGRLSVGGLLAFGAYLTQLYSPIRGLAGLITTLHSASASAERILEVFAERSPVVEHPRAVDLGRAAGHLQIQSASFRYPVAGRDALRDVTLHVSPGEVVAVVGASGAGKSTLIKLLLRFHDPSSGAILLDGHDLRDLTLRSLRDNMAVVLQDTLVFDGTVRENILFGRPDADDHAVRAAARLADAADFIEALPDGYETLVGQQGRRLSGGQRQRLAIARGLIRDAPVVILDEPTVGVDAASVERLLGPLRRLMRGRTTLIISHNLLTVRDATRIVVLDAGRVVEEGTHHQLMARAGAYAALHRAHQGPGSPAGERTPAA